MTTSKLLISILFLSFTLRFYQLGNIPASLNWDEVSNAYNGFSILNTGRDEYGSLLPLSNRSFDDFKPPLYMYLNTISVGIFGSTSFAARLPSALFGFLATAVIYVLSKSIFVHSERKETLSLISAFLLSITPWHLQLSRSGFEANLGIFLTLSTVSLFLIGIKKHAFLPVAALLAGLSLHSYHAQRFFIPIFLITLTIFFKKQIYIIPKRYIILTLIIIAAAAVPLIVIFPSGALTSRLQSSAVETTNLSVNEYIRNTPIMGIFNNKLFTTINVYMQNYLSNFSPNFLFIQGDGNLRHGLEKAGMFPLYFLPFFLIGIYNLLKNSNLGKTLILLWFLLAPLPSVPAIPAPHAIRSSLMMIPVVLIVAIGAIYFILQQTKNRILIALSVIVLSLSFINYLHNYYMHYAIYSAPQWQFGYRQTVIETQILKERFDKISISEEFEQPHIFWLFYTGYSPIDFQRFGNRGQFDKYFFGQKATDAIKAANPRELYVSTAVDFPTNFKLLKTINYPDGQEAIKIGHYEKK